MPRGRKSSKTSNRTTSKARSRSRPSKKKSSSRRRSSSAPGTIKSLKSGSRARSKSPSKKRSGQYGRRNRSKSPESNSRQRSRSRQGRSRSPKRRRSRKAAAQKRFRSRSPPRYSVMVDQAIRNLSEKEGSSKASIMEYIMRVFKPCQNLSTVGRRVRNILNDGVREGVYMQLSGSGSSALFKMSSVSTSSSRGKVNAEIQNREAGEEPENNSLDVWIWSPQEEATA